MAEQKSNRRTLIKSIVAGSGAALAGNSLPESWAKPIVDLVMLPAHAQTTGGGESGSLYIPGFLLNCSDSSSSANHENTYQVDDTGEFPVLAMSGILPAPAERLNTHDDVDMDSSGYHHIFAAFIIEQNRGIDIEQDCNKPYIDTEKPIDEVFIALSGTKWRATGKLIRTVSSVSVSNILLKPD